MCYVSTLYDKKLQGILLNTISKHAASRRTINILHTIALLHLPDKDVHNSKTGATHIRLNPRALRLYKIC